MQKILLAWIILAWAQIGLSQTITILDGETREPLERVALISEKPKASAITNAKGQADIAAFKTSEEIKIRTLGYKTRILSYTAIREAGFTITLEPSLMDLEEVVVSANRWRESSYNVPSSVVSINPKEVALQNPQTAADLLDVSGKVFVQKSQQGGGSPMIRGFATNRLLYTVDGVRMNNAIFRGGNIQNVINLDPFATENTEVLFGPGSVIYGSDAIGGVMSFQTLTPQLSLDEEPLVTGKAVSRYSSANSERTGHFDVNVGWKKWALLTSFSSWQYGHLRQGRNGPDDYLKGYHVQRQDSTDVVIQQEDPLLQKPTAYTQTNFMQKVRYKPGPQWDFEYGFHFSETSAYGRYDRHNRMRNGLPLYAEWNYGPQKWMMNNLIIKHQGQNYLYDQMTVRLAQQSFGESRINRDLNSNIRQRRAEDIEAYSANLDFTKSVSQRHTLFYGAEYVRNDVQSNGTFEDISTGQTFDGPDRYPEANWTSIAVYLNDEFRVNENFTLQSGVRYNQFIVKTDFSDNLDFYPFPFRKATLNKGALTGSLGGVYRPSSSWTLKANFSTAFRSPNVDDVGKVFDSEPGSVVVPNPDLQAEYAYSADLGIAKLIGERVKIEFSAYYTLLNNALVRRDFQLNGRDSIFYDGELSQVQALQNAAESHVYGLQAGIDIEMGKGFRFSSNLNFQNGEERLDGGNTSPTRHAAPLFGVSRLRYSNKALQLEFNARYQGEREHEDIAISERDKVEIYALDANGNTYAPAWYTLNLKARYQLSKTFSISTGLENITDQRYRPYSSGISGPGRNFIVSLSAEF